MAQYDSKTSKNVPKWSKMPWNEPKTAKNASKWPKMAQKSTKTHFIFSIELNCPRIILNWIFYWIELAQNNFELNIFLNWILTISFELEIELNHFWQFSFESKIELNHFQQFSFESKIELNHFRVKFNHWLNDWMIESSNCTSQGSINMAYESPTGCLIFFVWPPETEWHGLT